MPTGISFVSLSAGNFHACGVTASGNAYCWGFNLDGQLGNGTTWLSTVPVPVTMPVGIQFSRLTLGQSFSCALTNGGDAFCWGDGALGQVGNGASVDALIPTAVAMPPGVHFASVSAGDSHSCALSAAGASFCWGSNASGAFGSGNFVSSNVPVATTMPAGVTFSSIVAGSVATCALDAAASTVYCWGNDAEGELGNGSTGSSPLPGTVAAPTGVLFDSLASGRYHSCAVASSGFAYCWGYNGQGQVGDGTTTNRDRPTLVNGSQRYANVLSGPLGYATFAFPLMEASGDQVPKAAMQQFGRGEKDACDVQPANLVDFPALGSWVNAGWGASWAQWPNGGAGGYVCTRQPFYTSAGTWAVK